MDNLTLEDVCKFKHLKKLKPDTREAIINASTHAQERLNTAFLESVNPNLLSVALTLRNQGLTVNQATDAIYNAPARRPYDDVEVGRAVETAYSESPDSETKTTTSRWKKPAEVSIKDIRVNVARAGIVAMSRDEMLEQIGESPEVADNPTDFVRLFFNGVDAPVYIGNLYHGIIEDVPMWLQMGDFIEGERYDQVLANPMKRKLTTEELSEKYMVNGRERLKYASGGRCSEFASDDMHVITFESDKLTPEEQFAIIAYLAQYLPLVSIVYSGGGSYHATFSLRGVSYEQVMELREALTAIGGDESVMAPYQLVRLGGIKSTKTGNRLQEVLWIDPEARMRAVDASKLAELLGGAEEDERTEALWQYMLDCAFDEQNKPPHKPGLLGLSDVDVLWRKNVHTLVAQSKAGKTHAMAAMIHTMLTGERTLGFTIGEPIAGKVAYLDFEQDDEDFHNVMTRAGATKDRVLAFPLAGLSSSDAQRAAKLVLERNDDIDAMFLDGYADLSADVNDQESAVALAAEWMALSKEHDVAILGVLHLNPGSDTKSRGHLGSQLERKSKVILQIDTDKDGVRETYTRFSRKREVLKGYGVRWRWCDFEDGFIELAESKAEQKVRERVETMREKASEVAERSTLAIWAHGTLVKDIMEVHGVKESQAKTYITQWTDNKIMRKEKDGYHYDPF